MLPVLASLDLGGATVALTAYAAFVCAAALAAGVLGVRAAAGLGVGRVAAVAGIGAAVVAGLVGARLLSVVLDWPAYAADPGRIVEIRLRGFGMYGGLVAGSLAALAVARRWGVDPARLADRAVVAVVAGIVLIRVGCFLNGCCAGVATDLPWGVTFPARDGGLDGTPLGGFGFLAVAEESSAVHPTQLYEIAAVACGALAWALARRGAPAGVPALAFAAAFLAFRAADQVLRVPPPEGSLPGPAIVAAYTLVAATAGAAALAWWRRAARSSGRAGGTAAPAPGGAGAPVSAAS